MPKRKKGHHNQELDFDDDYDMGRDDFDAYNEWDDDQDHRKRNKKKPKRGGKKGYYDD